LISYTVLKPLEVWKGSDLTKVNPVQIQSQTGSLEPDLDNFQNLMGTSLSKDVSMMKFVLRSDQISQRNEPNCGKMPYLAILKNPLKICTVRSEAEDF